ncbi:hypothetical protein H0H87_008718 [Tephrocybe sp. NHM501043]|nr:hypothetical protein H0H87_008718 [Tephrocybe sp. NHM501043]
MCRGQFEQDDIDEANVVCSRNFQDINLPDSGGKDTDKSLQKDENDLSTPVLAHSPMQRSILTWRLPEWFNFSYATVQRRPNHPRRRQPNPFRPQSQEFSRLNAISQDVERGDISLKKEKSESHQPPLSDVSGPVVDHLAPVPWDDETTVDLPYDNPFYTRTFDNVLWLPRDPFGILDLDDTIDLRVSLCVDDAAGQLGSWLGFDETSSPEGLSEEPKDLSHQLSYGSLRPVNGMEDIDLPAVIAHRVNSRESDVEWAVRPKRPSSYRRKFSGATTSSSETGVTRRPSALRGDSVQGDLGGRARSSSMLSATPSYLLARSQAMGQSSVLQVHTEVLSAPTNASTSRLSHVSYAHSNNVTAREAIFNEVLAEERAAMVDQIEEEQANTQKAASSKSWLTAWMFNRQE